MMKKMLVRFFKSFLMAMNVNRNAEGKFCAVNNSSCSNQIELIQSFYLIYFHVVLRNSEMKLEYQPPSKRKKMTVSLGVNNFSG